MVEEPINKQQSESATAKQKNPRISALLYIQKTEENLLGCLTSLSNQILDDLEIICIDDSPDDTVLKDLLENYRKKEPRLKLAHTNNVGFGRAINQAIKSAHGEYVAIVQANDYLDPATYIELFALAKKHDADLVRGNYYERIEGQKDLKHEIIFAEESDRIIDPTESTNIFYQPPALWATIYRREYLTKKKLFFLNQKDDCYFYSFNFKTLAATSKIVLTDKAYVHHSDAILSSIETYVVNDEFDDVETFLKDKILWKTYAYVFQAIKFSAYYHHMKFLSKAQLEKFVLRTRAEFHDADNHRLLFKHYFPKDEWRTLRTILDLPEKVFLTTFRLRHSKKHKNNADKA